MSTRSEAPRNARVLVECKVDRGRRFLLAVLLSMQLGSAMAGIDESVEDKFAAAMLAYERNHWPAAYAGFVVLADAGHAEAARIALQMWRYGPPLYGLHFAVSDAQVDRWFRLCACAAACRTS